MSTNDMAEERKPKSIYDMAGEQTPDLDDYTPERGIGTAFVKGTQSTAAGLMYRGKQPDKFNPKGTLEEISHGLGSIVPDLPLFAVGGAIGKVATGGNPYYSSASAFGFVEGTKKVLRDMLDKGDVKGAVDLWDRFSGSMKETGKGMLLGGAVAGASGLVTFLAGRSATPFIKKGIEKLKFPAEVGALVTGSSALEGRLPESKDYWQAALTLGMLKGMHKVPYRRAFKSLKRSPKEIDGPPPPEPYIPKPYEPAKPYDPTKVKVQKAIKKVKESTGRSEESVDKTVKDLIKQEELRQADMDRAEQAPRIEEVKSEAPKQPTTTNYDFLKRMKELKKQTGEEKYYKTLKALGYEKSNRIIDRKVQEQAIKELSQPETKPIKLPKPLPKEPKQKYRERILNKIKDPNPTKKPKPTEEFKNQFAKWVNHRKASQLEGHFAEMDFKKYDGKGMETIHQYQAGEKVANRKQIQENFDNIHAELNQKGIETPYKSNYLPHVWANSPQQISEIMGRRLGLRPSFTFEKKIETYKEGMQAREPLSPKYNKISKLVGHYEIKARKAIADREFFDYLITEGLVKQSEKAPQDWVTLNPDRFPLRVIKYIDKDGNTISHKENVKAAPEVARMINNYLGESPPLLAKTANYASDIKNIVLSAGIPKTGINIHGLQTGMRFWTLNKLQNSVIGPKFLLHPDSGTKFINENRAAAIRAVKNGMALTSEEHSFMKQDPKVGGNIAVRGGRKVHNFNSEYFEEPLFNKILPAWKLKTFIEIENGLIKKGMRRSEASKIAAKQANNILGGHNWDELGRSKISQDVFRCFLLAPDWLYTQKQIGAGLLKALRHPGSPQNKAYRKVMTGFMGTYAAMNVANLLSSGHLCWNNDAGHEFEVEIGRDAKNKKRYFRPFGTAFDFLRLPTEAILAISKGDLSPPMRMLRNRFSIPLGVASGLVMDVDPWGNPVWGKNKYGRPMAFEEQMENVTSALTRLITPQYVGGTVDILRGKASLEQGIVKGFELPFRYAYPKKSPFSIDLNMHGKKFNLKLGK